MTDSQWKWADLIVKSLVATAITAAVAYYGIQVENNQNKLAMAATAAETERDRQDRRLDTLVEFASAQKKLDVDVGTQLFRAFIDKYLDVSAEDTKQIKENIVLLRLIALNFQDVPINLKPLFEDLDERLSERMHREASGTEPAGRSGVEIDLSARLSDELRGVAKEVANRQAFRLTFLKGGLTSFEDAKEGDVRYFESVPFAVRVNTIGQGGVEVEILQTELDEAFEPVLAEDGKKFGPFDISYFDMPLIDNVKVNERWRLAVLLKSVDGATATLRGVSFPGHLATDRFDVKELSRNFTDDVFQEEAERPPTTEELTPPSPH